jgi:hypothetical protein
VPARMPAASRGATAAREGAARRARWAGACRRRRARVRGGMGRARQVGHGEVAGRGGKPAAGAGPRARQAAGGGFPFLLFFSSFSFSISCYQFY